MSRLRFLLPLLVALWLAGCGEIKYVMNVDPEQRPDATALVWPAPPDKPRYRYVGQLYGQDNFVRDKNSSGITAKQVFYWLVGLLGYEESKLVLKRPQSGMVDAEGRILVTDIGSHAVFMFDQALGKLEIWEYAAEDSGFLTPIGIAGGPRGEVLVADAELGLVIRLSRDGKPLGSFGKDILKRPTGLARDAKRGRTYVSDTHSHDVKVFDDDGKLLDTIGKRGEENGEMNFPTHLAFAGDKLYVSDTMNARVLIFSADGKFLRSLGQRGLHVGELTRPKGVTLDSAGNLYIIESYYDHLLVFDSADRFLLPIGGVGKGIGQFYLPAGAWSDDKDRIYVADMFNGRIMIFQFLGND